MSYSSHTNRGFTLVEMMIVITILAIFTVISLVDYRDFGKKQAFVNTMYDTALDIRQVQANGITVKETQPGTEEFNVAYGIHIQPDAESKGYWIFADRPLPQTGRDNTFTSGQDQEVGQHILSPGFIITDACGIDGGTRVCTSDESNGFMDIVFARPNPDALISVSMSGVSSALGNVYYQSAEITIQSPEGGSKKIYVDASGQISIR